MSFSARSRVVTTPELLRLVFEYCPRCEENRRNALVSKTWSNEALNVLWHDLESLFPLFSLLAPLKHVSNGEYGFHRHIRPSDWVTFQKYSWRVHEVFVDFMGTDYTASAFIDIASSRPVADLLPNLRRLTYHDGRPSFQFLPLLIPTTLTYIYLGLVTMTSEQEQATCKDILSYLPEKAPNLEHLDITIGNDFEAEFVPNLGLDLVLSALPRLKKIDTESYFLPSCLRALAYLPDLEILISTSIHRQRLDIGGSRFPDAFPSLTNLSISSYHFQEVAALLDTYKPNSLRRLSVSSSKMEHGFAFPHLLDVASSVCLDLKVISLEGMRRKNPRMPEQAVSANFFHVLYRRLNLTSLTLSNPPPLSLNVETISDLLIGLPSLRVLCLDEFPANPPTLPLSSLSKLAPLCPYMEKLVLYMDTRLVLGATSPRQNDLECFERLKHLDVGPSPLDSSALEVTSFLSSILPEGCRLSRRYDDHIPADQRTPKFETWKPVVDFLPMLIRMRKAEKLVNVHPPRGTFTKIGSHDNLPS